MSSDPSSSTSPAGFVPVPTPESASTPVSAPAPRAPAPPGPDSFVRDPHKLIVYVVPFPAPSLPSSSPIPPLRFVLYTPPPPPLLKTPDERTTAKIQRKWQEEVRAAHATPSGLSWKALKAKVMRGVDWAAGRTTSADLEFLTRIPRDGERAGEHSHTPAARIVDGSDDEQEDKGDDKNDQKDKDQNDATPDTELCSTVKLDAMVLLYPPTLKLTEDELRAEFISSLMRTKSKAQRDAAIATGLLPVTAVLDWALVFVGWVFGGALEVDAVWMANSLRGAKTARSVTRRLASTSEPIALECVPSDRAAVLEAYLLGQCISRDAKRFGRPHWGIPTEAEVMETIGWQASGAGASGKGEGKDTTEGEGENTEYESQNWEDEAWERDQVVRDLRDTMGKAARGWDRWIGRFVKNPDKARRS